MNRILCVALLTSSCLCLPVNQSKSSSPASESKSLVPTQTALGNSAKNSDPVLGSKGGKTGKSLGVQGVVDGAGAKSTNKNGGDSVSKTTISTINNNSNEFSNMSSTVKPIKPRHFRMASILVTSIISGVAFLLNFSVFVNLCSCKGVSVMRLFGIALSLFNLVLVLYCIAMAGWMYMSWTAWPNQFCQGLVSVKLFSIGTIVWCLMMLTFQNAIRNSCDGEEREAVFKGIVYIMEGMMLSGVFAIMSWIHLTKWNFLCTIISAQTSVQTMLIGIELTHYAITFMLIVRFPFYWWGKFSERQAANKPDASDETKQKQRKKRDKDQEHPIFIILLITFTVWVGVYSWTYYADISFESKAVVRLNGLLVPLIFQPILFSIRNTCICTCVGWPCCRKKKEKGEDSLLACSCEADESCSVCEDRVDGNQKKADSKNVSETCLNQDANNVRNRKDKTPTPACGTPVVVANSPEKPTLALPNSKQLEAQCNIEINITSPMTVNRSVMQQQQKEQEQDKKQKQQQKPNETEAKPENKKEPISAASISAASPASAAASSPAAAKSSEDENSSPRHHRQNQAPSFIPLDETPSSPKSPRSPKKTARSPQKQSKELLINKKSVDNEDADSEGRQSRGPTFYHVKQKQHSSSDQISNSSSKKNSPIIGEVKKQQKRSEQGSELNRIKRNRQGSKKLPLDGENDVGGSDMEIEESAVESKETDNLMLNCNDVATMNNKSAVPAQVEENGTPKAEVRQPKCLNLQKQHKQPQRHRKKHKRIGGATDSLLSQESTDADSPIRLKNNQSLDSLEWDHTYSYSESGSSSSSPIADQQPHCHSSPPQSTTPLPARASSKASSTGSTRTAPISSIEWDPTEDEVRTGSAECEWEPYVVDEPHSGRSSGRDEPGSGRGSACPNRKGQMVKKGSYEATVSPVPIK